MSNKIDLALVAQAMKEQQIDPAKLRAVLEQLNAELAAQGANEDKAPAVKKQYVLLVSDPDSLLPKTDFAGWVLQIPEDESPATTQERIFRAAYDYNASRKGRLYPAKTVGEALENVPAKYFKEAECWVKTRTPILVLRTDNEVPNTELTAKLSYAIRTDASEVAVDGSGIHATETASGKKGPALK